MALTSAKSNWIDRAVCRDLPLELFFEAYESNESVAKNVDILCSGCPVKQKCLRSAVDTDTISTTGVRAGIFFVLGKVSKAKNSHKSPEQFQAALDAVETTKLEIANDFK